MRRIVKLRQAHRLLAMFLAVVMVLSMVPLSAFAANSSAGSGVISTDIGEKDFVVGTATEFEFTSTANDDANKMVRGYFEFDGPDGSIAKLEYYETNDGQWYEMNDAFGPETGFPMSDIKPGKCKFRVTFDKTGIYTVKAYLKVVADGTVLCSTEELVQVSGTGSSLTTDINQKVFVVGDEAKEFSFTTSVTGGPNTDAGRWVRGYFEFSDPDAIEKLEYQEGKDGPWYELNGAFGPDTGFPMTNFTSQFRASFKKAGTYTVKAYMKDMQGNILCVCAADVVVKSRSEISFEKESIEIKYTDVNATNKIVADVVDGAEYTYESSDKAVAEVNEYGILTPKGIGEAKIKVTRKENADYVEASAEYTVKVVPGVQDGLTWDNTVPDSIKWNVEGGYTNTVSGGSGTGTVTYSSDNTDVAEVDANGKLTLKKPGTVTIAATKSGDPLYEAQTASYTLVVIKSEAPALSFDVTNPDAIQVGEEYTNKATGGYSDGLIEYSSSNSGIASVDTEGKVTAHKVPIGQESATVTITAVLQGNDYYDAISVTYNITVYRAPQTALHFEKGVENQKITYGQEYINALIGGRTTPVTYKSLDESVATVDNNGKVTALKSGTVTITASVPESEEYETEALSYELVIELADQNVSFDKGNTNIPAITYGDSYQNQASAKTPIIYSSDKPEIAEVASDGKLIIHKSGTVTITATAAATEQYAQAIASYTITINKAAQTIGFEKGENVDVTFNDNENQFSNPASSNATNGDAEDKKDIEISYSIVSGGEYIVDGTFDSATGSFEIKGAGTIIVKASFTENERYNANTATYTVVVKQDDQTIAFDQPEYEMINGDNSFVAPATSEQGNLFGTGTITYVIEKDDNDVVSAIDAQTGALTFTNRTGQVTIRATKTADANYNEATATYTLTIKNAEIGQNVFHTLVGEKINTESEWYTGNVSVKAADGYLLSYKEAIDEAEWLGQLDNAVTEDGAHAVTFYVKHIESGKIYEAQTITIKKDTMDPEGEIKHEGLTGWEKFLSIITLGLWDKTEMSFTIEQYDASSGVAKVEYCVVEGTTEVMEEAVLEVANLDWQEYKGSIPVASDKIFVVYAKVTDHAGQYIYVTTNGIVFDRTAVPDDNIKMNVITEGSKGFYNSDVEINVQIDDAQPSSGIKSVAYEVWSNNKCTQEGKLFEFNNDDPKYEDLVPSWDSADNGNNIVVDSKLNNSDGVSVKITVVDNAGNTRTKEITLNICTNQPTLEVSYVDDPAAVETYNAVTYYDKNRVAKVVVTGRTSVFGASVAPEFIINETLGDTAKGKTYEVVDWVTSEVDGNPDAATHTYLIKFNGSANYEFSVEYTDIFGNNLNHTSNKFAVDHEKPTASVTIDKFTWTELLKTLTFGLWKKESVNVTATPDDATSPIKQFEMYRTDSTAILTSVQLDELYAAGGFEPYQAFSVDKDAKFVVYLRVEDYAGHYDYICSDGFVVDMTDSEIVLTPEDTDMSHNNIPLYNGDVDVRIDVAERMDVTYSGIKEVKYWVTCDGVTTQEEVLYSFNYAMSDYGKEGVKVPSYADLLHEFSETVTIKAAENNSCDVVLNVSVTDNAGNVANKSVAVDIDITEPTIQIAYDNNLVNKEDGNRGYYPANRSATITITERTGHFEAAKATAGIKIKAVDAKGNPIVVNGSQLEVDADGYLVDITELFGTLTWKTVEGETPEQATHTLVLPYHYDANYTFDIGYTDLAEKAAEEPNTEGQKTPYEFTIDKVRPTATITVGQKTWDKLLNVLTFGLFSKEAVMVSATRDDITSPIESVQYYKTSETERLSLDTLEAITTWEDITSDPKFEISEDEKFVVYLKVTDYAGNCLYINSDGYVVDSTDAQITLTPEKTDRNHGGVPLYDEDVDVQIHVLENTDEAYSGIKEVKYWVTCDGKITHEEETLYAFDYSMDDYVAEGEHVPYYADLLHEFTETVTIEADNNNSCNVILYVTVTDNAGNVATKSVAVDIDIVDPTITVDFDNDKPYKVVGDKGYFPASRRAEVVITERTGHFEADRATAGIRIKAVDAGGKVVIEDTSKLISNWKHEGTGDAATHTATIDFSADANYDFTLSYADLATNPCEYDEVDFADDTVAKRYFAVDKKAPTGTITAEGLKTWDKLIEILTFGLWSKDSVDITGTTHDVTTPVESVSYYKTSDITAKKVEELNKITTWTKFDGITVRADEQFVVYLRIIDSAGNVTYISTNGIIVDDTIPAIESVEPEITITPEPTHGIYNSDVTIGVSVVDPKVGETNAYAGLQNISYEVYNLGTKTQEGTLYSFGKSEPTYGELKQTWSKADAIVVDKELNNSNDVKIVVYAEDNAGNRSRAECNIKIDITPAEIEVSYDNNTGDTSYADSTYFKENRTAKIVVTERNFNPEDFKYLITNTDGSVPVISKWETKAGSKPNGDDTTHTATIRFDQDGDYEFNIESCVDLAMNANKAPTTGTSLAPWSFTIDKTAPVVSVAYDNNSNLNGNYYKEQRIATITVTEHNFEAVSDRLRIMLAATDDGVEASLPTVGKWTSKGDVHTITITYVADSLYTFDFDYTDKAGNAAADIAEQSFYVDKTSPVVSISGIVDQSANNADTIGFTVTATDTNMDQFTVVLTASVKDANGEVKSEVVKLGSVTDITNGKRYTVNNIDADGIYRITCTIVDKAGNAYTEVTLENEDGTNSVESLTAADTLVQFSVNRDGSSFELDKNTDTLVDNYYVYAVDEDVVIREVNTNKLLSYKITLNGLELVEGVDYEVTQSTSGADWKEYSYKLRKSLFEEEGEYIIVVSSTDEADNNAFSDVKDTKVSFIVDRTAPVVSVSGIKEDGRYQTDKQLVTLIPTDDGGALGSLIVRTLDKDGNVLEELVNLAGEELLAALEENGTITFWLEQARDGQRVEIICSDNCVGMDGEANVESFIIENVTVSADQLVVLLANPAVKYGIIVGSIVLLLLIAVVVVIVVKKNKSKNKVR